MFDSTETAVLQFSGGKDSTALLYLARPHLDRITVLFSDTGAVYPHVTEFVHETCRKLGARLEIVSPPIPVNDWIEQEGLPSDLVPIEAMKETRHYIKDSGDGPLVQSYMKCCASMIFLPMNEAVKRSGAKIVLRGSKACDARVGVPHGHMEDGIAYLSPLWDWTDEKVYRYLDEQGVTLPEHYASVPDSLDCWCCTAHLIRHGKAKADYTAKHYPELWKEIRPRFEALYDAITPGRHALASILAVKESRK